MSQQVPVPPPVTVAAPSVPAAAGASRRFNRRGRLVRRALAVADLTGLTAAFLLAALVYGSRASATNRFSLASELRLFVVTLPLWLLLAKLQGLYDRDEEHAGHTTVDDLLGIVKVVTIGTWLLFVVSRLTGIANPYPSKLIVFWAFASVLVVGARLAARAWCRRRPSFVQNAILIGSSDAAQLLVRKFASRTEYGVNLVGFVDARTMDPSKRPFDRMSSIDDLPELVERHNVERVIVEFPDLPREQITSVVRDLRRRNLQVDIVPRLYELIAPSADIHTVEGLPLVGLPPERAERSLRAVKRTVDIVLSGFALVLLAPAFVLTALQIKLDSKGPIFYRHTRVGAGGRSFSLIKFRTMYVEGCTGEGNGGKAAAPELLQVLEDPVRKREFEWNQKVVDDPRVTPVGRFLRRLSLDELPQLVNVLRGDMSLVGPRPVTRPELARYEPDVETLLTVRPGVTGYWQVNGRSDTSWDDRVRLDLSYVNGWSPKLDFLILGKTFWVLLTGRGAY